jgi:N-acylglucosamine 2-epimerase
MSSSSTVPHLLSDEGVRGLSQLYLDGLINDVVPFWFPRSVDEVHGGFMFARDRDGTLLDTDKGIWQQGRAAWLLATLYNEVEPRPEWLQWARHGIDFLHKHGFDDDGRMFFMVSQEGRPLRKRRYIFSETFMIVALAAYARAAHDPASMDEAVALYQRVLDNLRGPGILPPKWDPETRPMKGLAIPMILMITAQVLRRNGADPVLTSRWIDDCIDEVRRDFMHPELNAVLETVGANGEFLDHFDGRTLNPGHSIEAAWFILAEAKQRNDPDLAQTGLQILDWMWELGWDKQYGGITYFVDVLGKPVQEYWHDMKFWWPQNEAIIATLLAWQLTGNEKYARWHQMIHDWTYALMPDPEHGEWFGYFHRDGRLSSTLKGNMWKTAFHIPRMQLICWQLCEELLRDGARPIATGTT